MESSKGENNEKPSTPKGVNSENSSSRQDKKPTKGQQVWSTSLSSQCGVETDAKMPKIEGDRRELRPLNESPDLEKKNIEDDVESFSDTSCCGSVKSALQSNVLVILTLAGVVLGVCLGFGLREAHPSDDVLLWIGLPGELFIRALKSTIVPLVVCMVISCTSTLDPKSNGKIAVVGFLGFLGTQIITASLAICLFFIFRPGSEVKADDDESDISTDLQTMDIFADLIRNIFPDNVVTATFSQVTTVYEKKSDIIKVRNESSPSNYTSYTVYSRVRGKDSASGTNILGLITVCAAIGLASSRILKPNSEFLAFFRQGQDVVFVVIRWLFWTTPIGVLSLIAVSIAVVEDINEVFYRLGMLVASVTIGLTFYIAVVMPLLLFLFRRKNPFVFLSNCVRPFIIAFASTATSVALPEMMTSCDQNKLNHKVSSFVIPISITLHADGSSFYITAATLFVAQSSGQGVSAETIFIVGIMAAILSLAIPPVPSASIVTIVIILTALNYPLHDVALLFAVEWLLDRARSGTTAIGHIVVAGIADALCSKSMAIAEGSDTHNMEITIPEPLTKERIDGVMNGHIENTPL